MSYSMSKYQMNFNKSFGYSKVTNKLIDLVI
jgi:hypothetical protein